MVESFDSSSRLCSARGMRHPSLLFVRLLKYNPVLVQNFLFLEAPPLVRVFRVVASAGLTDSGEARTCSQQTLRQRCRILDGPEASKPHLWSVVGEIWFLVGHDLRRETGLRSRKTRLSPRGIHDGSPVVAEVLAREKEFDFLRAPHGFVLHDVVSAGGMMEKVRLR